MSISNLLRGISIVAALLLSQQALAGYIEIGGDDCGSCDGGVFTLSSALQSTGTDARGRETETHRITYTLDLSDYSGNAATRAGPAAVTGLAYHVTNAPSFVSVSNVSDPTSGSWIQELGNIARCGNRGFGGWVCLDIDYGSDAIPTGTTEVFSWVSDITVLAGGLIGTWSIQADYDPHRGQYLSESAAVPIPGALVLFATALGLFGIRSRWQKRQAV